MGHHAEKDGESKAISAWKKRQMRVCLFFHIKGSPFGGNGDDRRQRRKQGGAVGAAASRMQAAAQQTLGAATRVRSTSGVTVKPTLDEQSFFILKTAVPCYRGQQLRNNILVKLLLISVAGHYFLRYIRLSAGSKKWPGLPKPLLQGEVARRRRDGEVVQRRVRPL